MLKDILTDLEFLSTISKNVKPNFSDKSFTSTSEWFSTLKRRYKNEKGERGVIYIENLVDNINKIYKTLDNLSVKNLKCALIKASIGLNNIIYTYKTENQQEVANNYSKSLERMTKIINEIDESKNFFNRTPSIISSRSKN